MRDTDRIRYVDRYTSRYQQHGHSPAALGWGRGGREHVRFERMEEVVDRLHARSVLDVGCGFADFYDYLCAQGWTGDYTGIDLVPSLLEDASRRHPGLRLEEADIAEFCSDERDLFDVVVASGVFNARLVADENEDHICRSLRRMFELSRGAIYADFMTTRVDFRHEDAWHTDPAWAVTLATGLSRRFSLHQDYMPFEFALVVYRDDAHPDNVFRPFQ